MSKADALGRLYFPSVGANDLRLLFAVPRRVGSTAGHLFILRLSQGRRGEKDDLDVTLGPQRTW